jgi:hypothetical protein
MAFSAAPEFLLDFLLSRFTAMGVRPFLTLVVRTAAIARNQHLRPSAGAGGPVKANLSIAAIVRSSSTQSLT